MKVKSHTDLLWAVSSFVISAMLFTAFCIERPSNPLVVMTIAAILIVTITMGIIVLISAFSD